jgi:hypothetical protein
MRSSTSGQRLGLRDQRIEGERRGLAQLQAVGGERLFGQSEGGKCGGGTAGGKEGSAIKHVVLEGCESLGESESGTARGIGGDGGPWKPS